MLVDCHMWITFIKHRSLVRLITFYARWKVWRLCFILWGCYVHPHRIPVSSLLFDQISPMLSFFSFSHWCCFDWMRNPNIGFLSRTRREFLPFTSSFFLLYFRIRISGRRCIAVRIDFSLVFVENVSKMYVLRLRISLFQWVSMDSNISSSIFTRVLPVDDFTVHFTQHLSDMDIIVRRTNPCGRIHTNMTWSWLNLNTQLRLRTRNFVKFFLSILFIGTIEMAYFWICGRY